MNLRETQEPKQYFEGPGGERVPLSRDISGVVLGLVKKGHLRRKKIEGRWAYVK